VSRPRLGPKTRFLFLSDSCGFVGCGAPSLTRGRVCRFQLLQALASSVTLVSKSHGTHDHILLSQIRDFMVIMWYCHLFDCDSQQGFGLKIRFIDHFNTELVITLNYSAIAYFHTLQFTPSHAKYFPSFSVFIRRFLVTASNNSYSSAFVLKSYLNGGSLPTAYSSKSKSKLCYDRRSVGQSVRQLRSCFCGVPSLMRGRVCRLPES
jgi:hypothetical protein